MKSWTLAVIVIVVVIIGFFVSPQRNQENVQPSHLVTMQTLTVTSSAFAHNGTIPEKYTCDGENVSPALEVSGIPAEAKTLALIMHDPDAPRAGGWTHWVRFNIPLNAQRATWSVREEAEPQGISGKGTGGNSEYRGPCPPSGTHRYFFTFYALDTELALKEDATKAEVEKAVEGHMLATGDLIGLYSRKNN